MEDGQKKGLYDSRFEHDACGIGAVVNRDGNNIYEVAVTETHRRPHGTVLALFFRLLPEKKTGSCVSD